MKKRITTNWKGVWLTAIAVKSIALNNKAAAQITKELGNKHLKKNSRIIIVSNSD